MSEKVSRPYQLRIERRNDGLWEWRVESKQEALAVSVRPFENEADARNSAQHFLCALLQPGALETQ